MSAHTIISAALDLGIGDGVFPIGEVYSIHRFREGFTVYWNRPEKCAELGYEFGDNFDELAAFIRGVHFKATPIARPVLS